MNYGKLRAVASAVAIMITIMAAGAVAGCSTTTATSQGWGAYNPGAVGRTGRVEWIQEIVQRREGNPAAGAVAGAVIGGIIGHALTGGRGGGAFFGAAHGALIGADASVGTVERRLYQIVVRFDDGGVASFPSEGYPPFQINERVGETPQGLVRL